MDGVTRACWTITSARFSIAGLGTQNLEDGGMSYFLPLGSGYWKYFNSPYDSFWCCTGTGVEEFAKTADTIYFHDDHGIFVNLFIASEVAWPEKGLRLEQQTNFPEEEGTALVFHSERPVDMALNIRIPGWATSGGTIKVEWNGAACVRKPRQLFDADPNLEGRRPRGGPPPHEPADGDFAGRRHSAGRDVWPAGSGGAAGRRGPDEGDVLRGVLNHTATVNRFLLPSSRPAPTIPLGWLKPVAGQPLTFQTVGQEKQISLIPLYKLFGERYAVYWKTASTAV